MKNNKKGFISITIIYSFFILFITVLLLIMYSYINDRKMSNKIKSDLINTLRDKSPDISISSYGSSKPHPSYTVNVLILDGGNGISSARYIWSSNPLADPYDTTNYPDSVAFSSYNENLTSPSNPGYYYLIVRACDVNNHCKTAITSFFDVGDTYICVKATTLHNETCQNTDASGHCLGYGLEQNNVINYGNLGSMFETVIGAAYDCDVNGDGEYDPVNERFYYIGDYYDPITKEYDNENAALVYYTNVHNGVANNSYTCAYTTGNTQTPTTAASELPTTTQWSGVTLLSESRDIISTNGYDQLSRVYNYTGSSQTFKANYNGLYKVELWGAQGGSDEHVTGGKGAYTSGIIELAKDDILYVYVGGESTSEAGGYNGGGSASRSGGYISFGGGGATDIRLVNGEWNDSESLASRIMVAGGGGGSFYDNDSWKANGGGGGTYLGLDGETTKPTAAKGGTQVAGGTGYNNETAYNGSFGQGGNSNPSLGSGGGAGYWGGGGTYHAGYSGQGGAGGSSYISGLVGSIAIKASDDLTPKLDVNNEVCTYPTTDIECSYHYSGKIFTEGQMIDASGREWIFGIDPDTGAFDINIGDQVGTPTHDGSTTMIGNAGNGFAKITFMGPFTSATLDNVYTYSNKAARLLTYQEVKNCIDINTFTGTTDPQVGFNNKCNFLFENTKFANTTGTEGYFLESYYPEENTIWVYDSSKNAIYSGVSKSTNNKYGVRPVIEVPKTRVQFN